MSIQLNKILPLVLGILTGFIGGLQARNAVHKRELLSSRAILANVKHSFQNETPIQDSWIATKPQPFQKFALRTNVYRGGLSRLEDHQLVRYEFTADAKTGSILDLQRVDY
ncbi:hypothetical protein [Liquorilactobacillus satsumensis]|uniref:PepSY domain-containing protein n=1 Tax=Liquorilactobacillus satsumensis DSM 16230 = JCM 12392 TaxID=1423801 RepID=A0A0R1V2N2_9LACO|nr:hypothetical protein [Liquorilactobacillus satsumensis]KRL99824.1 hypothetical protein FD50_GL002359 [Liquorilactobacillus satsumensis DSM 16230 = JCM 12392]MCC7665686.1 hypothetical protein [Liquorilactobacillus satsumensis]MCP9311898.1 hypothetical protein [Liquorilactobacillus satsumensis]MCP9328302.1 hypothetical protein [Liquorilactobacillus satsumensis]MCP9356521.1 hypothetical protein [Liquorilactobacillus satsumensis]